MSVDDRSRLGQVEPDKAVHPQSRPGPTPDDDACWNDACSLPLGHEGKHRPYGLAAENDVPAALREFVQWVATQRAYNGSDHQHAQSLYNECLNAVLPTWAEEFIAARPLPSSHTLQGTACSCGEWSAKLGESIHRGFDQHLLEVRKGAL